MERAVIVKGHVPSRCDVASEECESLVDTGESMTVIELSQLIKDLESKFGVSAAVAPMIMFPVCPV